jgi:hypothetical protein
MCIIFGTMICLGVGTRGSPGPVGRFSCFFPVGAAADEKAPVANI